MYRLTLAASLLLALAIGMLAAVPTLAAQDDDDDEPAALNTAFIGSAGQQGDDEDDPDASPSALPGALVGSAGGGGDDAEASDTPLPGSLVGSSGGGAGGETDDWDDVTTMPSTGTGSADGASLTWALAALAAVAAVAAATRIALRGAIVRR